MKTLFPYKILFGDVTMMIDEVRIDGARQNTRVDGDRREIDMSNVAKSRWETAELRVSVAGPASEIDGSSDAQAVLVMNCGPSNSRAYAVLQRDSETPAMWRGTLELNREEWFGRATIRAAIAATVDAVAQRYIGEAETWTVLFDDLPRPPVSGSLTVRWVDFANPDEDVRFLRRFSTDPWFLQIDPNEPKLLLNRGFEGLEALLGDRRRRPKAERALHDHLRASIAVDVWVALFNAALADANVDELDQSLQWPGEPWQVAVLNCLLPKMYDEKSREDALVEACSARTSADGVADLQQRLFPAALAQVRLPRLLRNGLRLMSNESVDETGDEDEED